MPDYEPEDDFTKLFSQAVCMMQEREYEEAIRLFDEVLEKEPVLVNAYALRGASKFFLERSEEALEDFNAALELDPNSVAGLAYRGQYYAADGRFVEALADLEAALEVDPESDHALRIRLKVYLQLDRETEAEADANALLKLIPDDTDTLLNRAWTRLYLGRLDEALEDNDRLLKLEPDDPEALVQRAHFMNAAEKFEDVVTLVDETLKRHYEGGRRPVHLKCWALLSLGQYDQAIKLFEESFEKEPFSIIRYGMAVALGRLGRFEECREKIREAIDIAGKKEEYDVRYYLETVLESLTPETSKELCIINFDREYLLWRTSMEAMEAEQYEKAIELYDDILRLNPLVLQAYNNKALIQRKLGNYDEALRLIEISLRMQETPLAVFRKAIILIDMNRDTEALELFDRLIETDPDIPAYYHRARIFYGREEYEKAVADLTAAMEIDPNDDASLLFRVGCYEAMKDYDKAFAEYARLLYFQPDHIGVLHSRASLYCDQEMYENAIRDLNRALEKAPEFQPAYTVRGRTWGRLAMDAERTRRKGKGGIPVGFPELAKGEFYEAETCWQHAFADLDRALELDPDDIGARWDRGYFAYQSDDYKKCVEHFTFLLQRMTNYPSGLYWRGWSLVCLGEYEKAIADFDVLVDIDPAVSANYYARGSAKNCLYRFSEAETDFRKAVEMEPDDAYSVHYLGHTLEWQGRFGEALPLMDKSIELQPENVEWYCCRSEILQQLGRNDEAIKSLRESIEADPNQSQAYHLLGLLQERQGDAGSARKNFELAARLPEEKPERSTESTEIETAGRGRALAALGRHEEALELYDKAMRQSERKDRFHRHNFWIARSLDALGRMVEALEQYRLALEHAKTHHELPWVLEYCRKRITELE